MTGQLREREPGDFEMAGGGVGSGGHAPEQDGEELAVHARVMVGERGQG